MSERKAGTEIMRRLPDQSIELVIIFIEASKKFKIKYHNKKLLKHFENHQRIYKKY